MCLVCDLAASKSVVLCVSQEQGTPGAQDEKQVTQGTPALEPPAQGVEGQRTGWRPATLRLACHHQAAAHSCTPAQAHLQMPSR